MNFCSICPVTEVSIYRTPCGHFKCHRCLGELEAAIIKKEKAQPCNVPGCGQLIGKIFIDAKTLQGDEILMTVKNTAQRARARAMRLKEKEKKENIKDKRKSLQEANRKQQLDNLFWAKRWEHERKCRLKNQKVARVLIIKQTNEAKYKYILDKVTGEIIFENPAPQSFHFDEVVQLKKDIPQTFLQFTDLCWPSYPIAILLNGSSNTGKSTSAEIFLRSLGDTLIKETAEKTKFKLSVCQFYRNEIRDVLGNKLAKHIDDTFSVDVVDSACFEEILAFAKSRMIIRNNGLNPVSNGGHVWFKITKNSGQQIFALDLAGRQRSNHISSDPTIQEETIQNNSELLALNRTLSAIKTNEMHIPDDNIELCRALKRVYLTRNNLKLLLSTCVESMVDSLEMSLSSIKLFY